MYDSLGYIILKTGERVEAGLVTGPDLEWANRIVGLLAHKGEPWNWQNRAFLTRPQGVEVYFYILHRHGVPFSNIMTAEVSGVGCLGHVWTTPPERQRGASSRLMALQMEHFAARTGKALFLDTAYESPAYWMYRKFGFQSIELSSKHMEYYRISREAFNDWYFQHDEGVIQPMDWACWPSAQALFAGDFPGLIRCAPLKLIGRMTTEGRFLSVMYDAAFRQDENTPPQALLLRSKQTGAVLGMAMWSWHSIWPDTCLVDIYCHPGFRERAGDLYGSLTLPDAHRYLAYVDVGFQTKADFLLEIGFRPDVMLKQYVSSSYQKTAYADVQVFEKQL